MPNHAKIHGSAPTGDAIGPRTTTHVVEGPFDIGAARRALAAAHARPEGVRFVLDLRSSREIHDVAIGLVVLAVRDCEFLGLSRHHHERLLRYLGAAERCEHDAL